MWPTKSKWSSKAIGDGWMFTDGDEVFCKSSEALVCEVEVCKCGLEWGNSDAVMETTKLGKGSVILESWRMERKESWKTKSLEIKEGFGQYVI